MKIDVKEQRQHFDDKNRQYKWVEGIEPSFAQSLEYIIILENLPKKKNLTVVDFGCGSGRLSLFLLSKGINVDSVDISKESLNTLTKMYKKYSSKSWGKLTTHVAIPNHKYDVIVGTDILHHTILDEDFELFKKHLNKGGRIVFSEPNALHVTWYLYYILHKIPLSIEKGILQIRYFNLKSKLKKHNYKDIELIKHGLISTPVLNKFPSLMSFNLNILTRIPILNLFCFRFIIRASV